MDCPYIHTSNFSVVPGLKNPLPGSPSGSCPELPASPYTVRNTWSSKALDCLLVTKDTLKSPSKINNLNTEHIHVCSSNTSIHNSAGIFMINY